MRPSCSVAVCPPSSSASIGIGGREHDGAAAVGEQLRQLVAQLLAQLEVEIGERLVEQNEVGVLDQRAGQRGALLLPAGQLGRAALQHRRQPQQLGDAVHAAVDLGLRHARDAQRRGDVLEDREVRIVDELLVDHRDVALLHGNAGDVLPVEPDLAGGRALEPGHQLHQRRLAGERRAEQDVEAVLGELDGSFRGCASRRRPA